MNLYVIRRPSGWGTTEQLQAAAAISKQVGDEEMREHAERAGLPATEIVEVAETVLVRPDPVAVAV
jgi:hypothetical protein